VTGTCNTASLTGGGAGGGDPADQIVTDMATRLGAALGWTPKT
jgi:hypothetical protein